MYRIKLNPNGTVERYKARLVAKGYTQREGIDFLETFSPVAKTVNVRILIALAATRCWPLHQLDINNAFLHGDLDEEVYMSLPLGFHSKGGTSIASSTSNSSAPLVVCMLLKSLYGLRQATRQWYTKLSYTIQQLGFVQSTANNSLFVHAKGSLFTALLVYVDDMVIIGNDPTCVATLKSVLDAKFGIKDLGSLKFFLGLEIARSKKGISLNQRKFALDILKETIMMGCKPAKSPMEQLLKLSKDSGELLSDSSKYRRLIGKLMYLTISRPDITYVVNRLSQFLAKPGVPHMQAATRILQYVKGTPGQGIFFPSDSDLQLRAYCDADWAGCPNTRKSLTRYCVFLGDALISWRSKKQSMVSRSSAEVKYRSMASTTCEVTWILFLLRDLLVKHEKSVLLYCDN